MTCDTPFLTIVTATYNCADCLPVCLRSLAEQSFADFEHVIIDGGSTDGTVDLIRAAAEARASSRLGFWLSERDTGIYNAWNKALPHVRGAWVLFLGADDVLYDAETLAQAAAKLRTLPPEVRTAYGRLLSVDEEGREIAVAGRGWEIDKRDFFQTAKQLPHTATFQRREVFAEHGGFDESFRISADFEYLCRELVGHEAAFLELFIARHVLRGVSVHPKTALRAWRETRTIIARHRLPVPRSFITVRILKSYVFYLLWRVLPEKTVLALTDFIRRHYWKHR